MSIIILENLTLINAVICKSKWLYARIYYDIITNFLTMCNKNMLNWLDIIKHVPHVLELFNFLLYCLLNY